MTEFGSDLILARLQQLHPKSIDLSLGRIENLLAQLDHPEEKLPPVIHIAGTNGKGSTLAMLDAMLKAAGHTVHRYISPHLVRFNERILLDGETIDEGLFAQVLDECERANKGEPITFFEITTAAALLAFSRIPADYLLLETGLGGRLDATNVVAKPELVLISPISMDHESYLGSDLRSIAYEKAGIIKNGVPVLSGPQHPEVLDILQNRARELSATFEAIDEDIHVNTELHSFKFSLTGKTHSFPKPALRGNHQFQNAALAASAALQLGLAAPAITQGLQSATWAARLQPIRQGRLRALLPPTIDLWLDGGHNPAAGEAIASSLDEIAGTNPVDVIIGMLETKSMEAFLAPLKSRVDRLKVVRVPDEPLSRDPIAEAEAAKANGWRASASENLETALSELSQDVGEPRTILICGSLYLAGHVLRY